jgi:predicted transcriptional regulator
MESSQLQTLLRFFKGLSNESRLKLLGLVAERERNVTQLAALLNITEPTVSHHLAKLQALDLVHMRAQGTTHYYSLKADTLQQLNKALLSPSQMATLTDTVEGSDAWENKVLRSYLVDERLTKIPDTRKKREVILKWLATQFTPEVRYPERELNAIIKRYHADCATLRREMIGYKLMQRERGVYWRPAV